MHENQCFKIDFKKAKNCLTTLLADKKDLLCCLRLETKTSNKLIDSIHNDAKDVMKRAQEIVSKAERYKQETGLMINRSKKETELLINGIKSDRAALDNEEVRRQRTAKRMKVEITRELGEKVAAEKTIERTFFRKLYDSK